MAVNVLGLVVLLVFYLIIIIVGILAGKLKKKPNGVSRMEEAVVAGRDINVFVGIFTMTATIVGGGFINGTAESIASSGMVWTLAPFGIFIGLITGGVVFARPMRERKFLTMLDPIQEKSGDVIVVLVYIATLCGDVFWTASILVALGTSLSVIVDLPLSIAIVSSSAATVCYTMFGQMISVAYTDIVQLIFIITGLILSLPFILTNDKVGNISDTTELWIGQFDVGMTSPWIDLFTAMIFGTIPWQSYFQRVLSVRSGRHAQILSIAGAFSAVILAIPSVLIGAVATSADWTNTTLRFSPMALNQSSMTLPYVLHEFTPSWVAVLALGAVSAAVMSSMDSSILGSSSMFTNNIYRKILRKKAGDTESVWVQTISIFCVGVLATLVSLFVPIVYGLFVLAADIVFVIVLPQLFCAVFIRWTNVYGAIPGFLVGTILRIGAGEVLLDWPPFIEYPFYSVESGQIFPFRTFAMIISVIIIVTISLFVNLLRKHLCKKAHQVYFLSLDAKGNTQTEIVDRSSSSDQLVSFPRAEGL
ncbi:high-affinity choline transporter 1-like [Saccostrea echinata]|uniref:high-affinity choline transporter 1-like n=1 Tax=Saccostrea echinata TaxID=191078 RepID=UPI002A8113FA|nr:high-affinity choline transporter 1-like [Saccostrea echinata]